jgi:hypothetical protein
MHFIIYMRQLPLLKKNVTRSSEIINLPTFPMAMVAIVTLAKDYVM